MGYIIVILVLLGIIMFALYLFRCHNEKGRASFAGFLSFCRDKFSKVKMNKKTDDPEGSEKKGEKTWLRRNNTNDIIVELQRQLDSVISERDCIKGQMSALESDWNTRFFALEGNYKNALEEIKVLEAQKERLLDQNKKLQEVARKLYPVSESNVSVPYCQFFADVEKIIRAFFDEVIEVFSDASEPINQTVLDALVSFVDEKSILKKSIAKEWYILLSVSSAVTAEAAKDVEQKDDNESLDYLLRVSFEQYFRPLISSLILLAEKVRENTSADAEKQLALHINDFREDLRIYDINIIYCKSGEILSDVDFEDYEIRIPDALSTARASNYITKVIKYGVNCYRFDCVKDKTIVEMVL